MINDKSNAHFSGQDYFQEALGCKFTIVFKLNCYSFLKNTKSNSGYTGNLYLQNFLSFLLFILFTIFD